jgi:hypothetical protein
MQLGLVSLGWASEGISWVDARCWILGIPMCWSFKMNKNLGFAELYLPVNNVVFSYS